MFEVRCNNGHRLKAKPELAGKKVKCPKCGVVVSIPMPDTRDESEEEFSIPEDGGVPGSYEDDYGYDHDPWSQETSSPVSLPPRQRTTVRKVAAAPEKPDETTSVSSAKLSSKKWVLVGGAVGGLLLLIVLVKSLVFPSNENGEQSKEQIVAVSPESTPLPMTPAPVEPIAGNQLPMVPEGQDANAALAAAGAPELPEEPKPEAEVDLGWNVRTPETHNLVFDERFILEFKLKPGKLQYAYVPEGLPAPSSSSDWTPVDLELSSSGEAEASLTLEASVNAKQTVLIPASRDFEKLQGKKVPFRIRLGSEIMEVISVDQGKDVLEVKRTSPVSHSVSERLELLKEGAADDTKNQGRPYLQNDVQMHWFPPQTLAGKGTLFVRYSDPSSGKRVRFGWEVQIADAETVAKLNREERGAEDDGLAPLEGSVWKYASSPLPVRASADEADVRKANARIKDVVKKMKQTSNQLIVSFRTESDQREIVLGTIGTDDVLRENIDIPSGAGIPLPEIRDAKETRPAVTPLESALELNDAAIVSNDENGRLRVQAVGGLPSLRGQPKSAEEMPLPIDQIPHPYLAVAENGSSVFLMAADNEILRCNMQTMKQEALIKFRGRCESVCMCSEGLVVLCRGEKNRRNYGPSDPAVRVIDFEQDVNPDLPSDALYLVQPQTLEVLKSYVFYGRTLAGCAQSSRVFVGDEQHICIVDMLAGTLSEIIPIQSEFGALVSRPDGEEVVRLAQGFRLYLNPVGSTLLAIGPESLTAIDGASGVYTFATGDGTAKLSDSIRLKALQGTRFCMSRASELLMFRNGENGGTYVSSTSSFSNMMPNTGRNMPLGLLSVMDSENRAFLTILRKSLELPGFVLRLAQGRRTFELEFADRHPLDLSAVGQGRYLLTTSAAIYLVQVNASAPFWPFEKDLMETTNTSTPLGEVTQPTDALRNVRVLSDGQVESGITGLEFLAKSPSGDAYFLSHTEHTADPQELKTFVHRIDAVSNVETHRWSVIGSNVLGTFQQTANGLLYRHGGSDEYQLLEFEDLSSSWRINFSPHSVVSASPHHGLLACSGFGHSVFDTEAQRFILREGFLHQSMPELPAENFSLEVSSDPATLLLKGDRGYRKLKVESGRLVLDGVEMISNDELLRLQGSAR